MIMDKERVRHWLQRRWRERAPLPSPEQIRKELGLSHEPQPAGQAPVRPSSAPRSSDK
jgi:hypothetical protein